MDLSFFLIKIAELKIAIAKLVLAVSLLHPIAPLHSPILGAVIEPLPADVLSLDATPVEEPTGSLIAQRVDSEGWYTEYSSGEKLFVPNSLFKTAKQLNVTDAATEVDIRNRLKTKFQAVRIDWDNVFFTFDKSGNIVDVEERQ